MPTTTPSRPSSRERLIEAARELFWLQGYETTTVAEILEKAEVNSGSLYYHFKSKEDLLLAVLDTYKEMLWPMVIEPVFSRVEDPIERIFGILEGYRQGLSYTLCTGGCPIGNLAIEVGDHHSSARQRIAQNFQGWCGWIQECLDDAGERLPAHLNRQQLAQFVLTVMEGAVMQARVHGGLAPFDACVAQLRDYFNHLLAEGTRSAQPGDDDPAAPIEA